MRSAALAPWPGLQAVAARSKGRRRKGSGSDLGFRQVSSLLYEATLVRGPQITMDGPDFTALRFRGMGRTGPRGSLMGRAKRRIFGPFLFFGSDLCLLAQFNV